MAETEELMSSMKVRDLILAYESISESEPARVEYNRPRAKSLGNILNKNVIVRSNDYETLEDIETALGQVDLILNDYNVYSKDKHVWLQEQFFNMLTCVINIESETENKPAKKKQLITKIQSLVSILNHKLPSNTSISNDSLVKLSNKNIHLEESKFTYTPFNKSKYPKYLDSPDSINKKLDNYSNKEQHKMSQDIQQVQDKSEIISVSKLKNFFEEKSKQSNGLEIVIKKTNPTIHYEVSIPYTERNLGAYRLLQKNYGNYMTNSGLLRNVDVNRSMSVFDLKKRYELGRPIIHKRHQSESENDITDSEESEESVDSVKGTAITQVATPQDEIRIISGENTEANNPEMVHVNTVAPQVQPKTLTSCNDNHIQDAVPITNEETFEDRIDQIEDGEQETYYSSIALVNLVNTSLENAKISSDVEQTAYSILTTEPTEDITEDTSDYDDIKDSNVEIVDITDSVTKNTKKYENLEAIVTINHSDSTKYRDGDDLLDQVSITTADLEELEAQFEKLAEDVHAQ